VTGESFAQVNNPDPFAPPVWRSPVYRTPEFVIWLVQLVRLLVRVIWFVISHPLLDMIAGLIVLDYLNLGWPGLAGTGGLAVAILVVLWLGWPTLFARLVTAPVRAGWRYGYYRRHWHAVMTITGLAPLYQGRILLPVLAKVTAGGPVDRVTIKLVSGQSPADFADRAEGIAHGLGVHLCRVRPVTPGLIALEPVRRDALADPIPALLVPETADPAGLAIGWCEDGSPWRLRLLGSHVLVAGATGAGKGSIIWSLIRAPLPGICDGWVRVWACDPKRMELSFGRDLFAKYADQAAAMVELLEAAVTEMHQCANWLRYGIQPKNPGPACTPARARARPTAANTSATRAAGSWSPANGPARRWPTTGPTARTGSWPLSARPPPTRPATPGNPSHPATPTTWNTPAACCTSSPTASNGTPPSPKPDAAQVSRPAQIFRQQGRRHEH